MSGDGEITWGIERNVSTADSRPKFGHWDFPRVRVKADLQQRSGNEFL